MTNGDRIRAMTDKELAHWWCYKRPCDRCPHDTPYGCAIFEWLRKETDEQRIIRPKEAEQCLRIAWLKQEAQE